MKNRISADELYRIREADLHRAISDFDKGVIAHEFADSTHFYLLVDGNKCYPPKAIVGLAAEAPLGRILRPSDFSGGESSSAFRLLWKCGSKLLLNWGRSEI